MDLFINFAEISEVNGLDRYKLNSIYERRTTEIL